MPGENGSVKIGECSRSIASKLVVRMGIIMKELVSVIVPAYQEELRIVRCLQSIFASTYRNLEVIVVNDGSTDDTEKVVEEFQASRGLSIKELKLVTISNGGAARARNYGMRLARGEYIGFVDADDMIHPEMIERLADSLRRGNDLSICRLLFCDEDGKPKFHMLSTRREVRQCPGQALKMIMWENIQMSICPVLFRREKIMGMGGELAVFCPENVAAFEDFAFICQYVYRCNGTMEKLDFIGYYYCRRKGSSSTRVYTARELCHALEPILTVGNQVRNINFESHKLLYAFMFMEFWYKEAFRSKGHSFSPNSENWRIGMKELERYADVFMKASAVAFHKKAAMWIVRKHPNVGWILAKMFGKLSIL